MLSAFKKAQTRFPAFFLSGLLIMFSLSSCQTSSRPETVRKSSKYSSPNSSENSFESGSENRSGESSISEAKTELQRFQSQFLGVFDTVTTVIALADSEEQFNRYLEKIKADLTHYHELYDAYNSYDGVNNIKTINDRAGIAPVTVDPAIIQLLEQCITANKLSKGHVNVAFGPVLEIWHDYRTAGLADPAGASLPPLEKLEEANQFTDISLIQIDKEKNTVFLPLKEMSLDVGSGAKGLACELAAEEITAAGLKNVLINVGGNVRAIGYRDGQSECWRVGVRDPHDSSGTQQIRIAEIHNLALVSSGSYERYYVVGDKRYHHIIHPETLFPKDNFDAVSIIAESSGFADSLTTALFNMTYEDGKALIDSLDGVAALWIRGDEVLLSERMRDYIKD